MEKIAGLNENDSRIYGTFAQFAHQDGSVLCRKGDMTYELDFADRGLVSVRVTPDEFDWTRVLPAIPDLTAGEQKQLRQLIRVGGRSPFAAAEELGISLEELRELLEKQRSKELIADLFHGGFEDLEMESSPVDYPVHGPIFLDEFLTLALTAQFTPREIARACVPLGRPIFDMSFLAGWPEPLDPEASPLHFHLADLEVLDGNTDLKTYLESRRQSARELLPIILAGAILGAIKPGSARKALPPWRETTLYELLDVSPDDSLRVLTVQYGRKLKMVENLDTSEEEKAALKDYLVRGFRTLQDTALKALYDTAVADGMKGPEALQNALETGLEREFLKGLDEARAGRMADAFRLFHHCLEMDPYDARYHAALGLMLVSGHPGVDYAPEEAADHFQKACDGRNSEPAFMYYLGVIREWLGDPVEAQRAYENALMLDETLTAARDGLERIGHV